MTALIDKDSPYLEKLDYNNLSSSEQLTIRTLITAGQAYLEERECNRIFLAADYTDEKHDGNGEVSIFVNNPPINSLTDIDILQTSFDTDTTTTTYTSDKFDIDTKIGEIRFKPGSYLTGAQGVFSAGFQNIQVTYNGGFDENDTELEPVKMLIAEFVIQMFSPDEVDEIIQRERLGDYTYAKANDYFEHLTFSKKRMLSKYKIRRVGVRSVT